jgi:hypothetical protein
MFPGWKQRGNRCCHVLGVHPCGAYPLHFLSMQPRASRTVRDSNSPNQPVWLWGQESSVVRTQQRKISNLAEFFGVIFGVDGHEHVRISGSR